MNLTERITRGPDRRRDELTPIVERRQTPRWMQWTSQNERSGKDLTGAVAA